MKSSIKVFQWLPRIICIMALLFVGVFAANAFQSGHTIWQQLSNFFIQLFPSLILLAFLLIVRKWKKIGGIIFTIIVLGLSPFVFMLNYKRNHSIGTNLGIILSITIPFLIVEVLFIVSHFLKKGNLLEVTYNE